MLYQRKFVVLSVFYGFVSIMFLWCIINSKKLNQKQNTINKLCFLLFEINKISYQTKQKGLNYDHSTKQSKIVIENFSNESGTTFVRSEWIQKRLKSLNIISLNLNVQFCCKITTQKWRSNAMTVGTRNWTFWQKNIS